MEKTDYSINQTILIVTRDINHMSKGLAVHHVQGIFFPSHQYNTFHRLNVEYLVPLQAINRQNVYSLLESGISRNLNRFGGAIDSLYSLRPQVEALATHLTSQGLHLLKGREHLRRQLLSSSRGSFTLYRAGMEADFASKQLAESLGMNAAAAQQRLLLAEHMLKDALHVNYYDYRARFELGWMYQFLCGRLTDAEFHFNLAAHQAQKQDPEFAVFILRHLADVRYGLKNVSGAIESMLQVLHGQQQPDVEYRYELARYLAAAGDVNAATQHLAQIVACSPIYYVQAQVEPDFVQQEAVSVMLRDLRVTHVKRIQRNTQRDWQNNALANMALPDHIDPNALFRQVIGQHLRVMEHLPYITLRHREQQICQLILASTQKRVRREIVQRSLQYERKAEQQRSRWAWINQTGGALLHTSVILLLAALMFFIVRLLAGLWGFGYLLGADSVVNPLLTSITLSGLIGLLLARFVPFGVNKLLCKQLELDNTLHLLPAPSSAT